MRLLVDQNLGLTYVGALRAAGHDVAWVRERDPRLPDDMVFAWAVSEQRIVVTRDKGFSKRLLDCESPDHTGVFLLRIEELTREEQVRLIIETLRTTAVMHGTILTLTPRGARPYSP